MRSSGSAHTSGSWTRRSTRRTTPATSPPKRHGSAGAQHERRTDRRRSGCPPRADRPEAHRALVAIRSGRAHTRRPAREPMGLLGSSRAALHPTRSRGRRLMGGFHESYPLAPLYRLCELRHGVLASEEQQGSGLADTDHDPGHRPFSSQVMAEMLGVSSRSVRRWERTGIPFATAERAAHEIGLTIHLVWPDEYRDQFATKHEKSKRKTTAA